MSFLPKDLLKEHGIETLDELKDAGERTIVENSKKLLGDIEDALNAGVAETLEMIRDDAPDTRSRRGYTITKVQRDEDGFWTARVTNGQTYTVDRKHGSWQVVEEVDGQERRREVLPDVAAALQAKVRPVEARERKAHEAAEEAARLAAKKPNTKETAA